MDEFMEKNTSLRKEADEIILQIWNEVEKTHNSLPEDERKVKNEEYGLVYFYRKNEIEKVKLPMISNPVSDDLQVTEAAISQS